jgi:hypothetical protein
MVHNGKHGTVQGYDESKEMYVVLPLEPGQKALELRRQNLELLAKEPGPRGVRSGVVRKR